MPTIDGLLHDPVARTSRRVSARLEAGDLVVPAEGGELRIASASLDLSAGGWQGQAVHLAWTDAAGAIWALTVDEPAALEGLAAALPPALAERVTRAGIARRRRERTGRLVLATAAAVALVPLLLLALLWSFRGPILERVVARLPTSLDATLGARLAGQIERGGTIVAEGPAADALRGLGERLVEAAGPQPHTFRFLLVRDPTANAFAAPGGLIVVHTGLVAATERPEELAGVLGHEMAHVLERHALHHLVHDLGLVALLRLLVGSPDGALAQLAVGTRELGALSFSRDQEREADRRGLMILARAGLDGAGLPALLARLGDAALTPPPWLSSHPASAERARALLEENARRGAATVEPLDLDWASVVAEARR